MRVSLIGMSNIGKSSWAHRIAHTMKAEHFNCDALIEKRLGESFATSGNQGLRGIADWMGLPGDDRYLANSEEYGRREQSVMLDIFAQLRRQKDMPALIDTTGSVIYTGEVVLRELRATTLVVYFEASQRHIETLFRNYIGNPKPVIWNGLYAPKDGETVHETLMRCYPLLLHERAQRYKNLAHITIPFEVHRNHQTDMVKLFQNAIP